MQQCWAIGQSGLPLQEDLFNVSICEPKTPGFLDILTSSGKRKTRDMYVGETSLYQERFALLITKWWMTAPDCALPTLFPLSGQGSGMNPLGTKTWYRPTYAITEVDY